MTSSTSNDNCLHARFEQQVALTPHAQALTCSGETLSYSVLNERANQLAAHLRELGVHHEDLVGLCLDRSIDTVVAILAVLKAGAAFVPMDPFYPAERVRMIVEVAECNVVILQSAQADRFVDQDDVALVVLDDTHRPWEECSPDNLENIATGDSLNYVMFTSGSTGKPKGVPITHGNVVRLFTSTDHWFHFNSDAAWAVFHSYAFDLSVWEMWGALLYGGRVVMVPYQVGRSPEDFYQLLVDEQVTHICQTPSAFRQLQLHEDTLPKTAWEKLSLQYVVLAGEALSFHSLLSWFDRHGDDAPRIINMYGITETTVYVTYRRVFQHEAVAGMPSYIGVPIPDQPCYILDENRNEVAVGEEGELYVGGAGNAQGYFKRPDLTAERFIESPFPEDKGSILYKSGDLVRREEGDMAYIGRIDTQVQIRGFRVELGEIEAQLETHEAVRGAAVLLREDVPGDARLVGYYLADAPLDTTTMRDYLTATLPPYMVPSRYVHMDVFPLNGNGKIDKRALPAPGIATASSDYLAPRNDCESALATLWAELLGVEEVGVEDSFFDLGGHSLLASQLIVRMEQQFSVRLPLRLILENPTIAAHAKAISESDTTQTPALGVLTSADRSASLPLSFAQERLWIIEQMQPGNATYNIPILFSIDGRLNVSHLRQAIDHVILRHEALRTLFTDGDPLAEQRVQESITVPFDEVALDNAGTDKESAFRARLTECSRTPMALTTGPLLRFLYTPVDAQSGFLGMVVHHAIFDGWSISVFLDDLATSYDDLEKGGDGTLPQLQPQYLDYTHWQRGHATGDLVQAQLAYWKQQLAGPLPVLDLPTDYPRPAQQTWVGSTANGWVDTDLTTSLNDLAKGHQKTLYAVLLSAWEILLHRYSGQEEILVGTVVAGRNHPDLTGLIGFFVNTVVLRNTLAADMPFIVLLDAVESTSIAAQENQDVPFERVVAEVQQRRDPSRSPLFQVVFVLHNTPPYEVGLSDAVITGEEISNGGSKFDLTLSVQAREGRLQLSLEYNTALFDPASAERIVKNYTTLLASICADPERGVGDFELVDDAERRALLEKATGPVVSLDHSQSLLSLFTAQAKAQPDQIAVTDGTQSLSFGDLDRRSNQLAHLLIAQGVTRGEGVPFYLSRSIHTVVAMLGTLKAGAAYVPLDLQDPPARRARVLTALGARVLLSEQTALDDLALSAVPTIALDDPEVLAAHPSVAPPISVKGDDLAYIIFTSGSTGEPKGVACNHLGVINLFNDLQRRQAVGPGDVCSIWAAFSFDASVYETWTGILGGATLAIIPEGTRLSPDTCLPWMHSQGVTAGYLPGYMMPALLDTQQNQAIPLRRLMVGVEPLRESLLADIVAATTDLVFVNAYGPTEATVYATLYPIAVHSPKRHGSAPIGRPIENTQTYILDDQLRLVPDGVPGELCIGGVGLARGYYQDPALTAQQFVPNPFSSDPSARIYRTGDLAYRRHDGDLQYLRRMGRYIKLRGLRIEPGEIESILRQHPAVADAVVILWAPDGEEGRLVAYVVPANQQALDEAALARYLEAELPVHMRPAQQVIVADLPRTVQGKIDRSALPPPPRLQHDDDDALPTSNLEKRIAARWQALLELDPIGLRSNFFDLGGHSLLAIQLLTQVNRDEGTSISLSAFFDQPTVEGMASRVLQSSSPADATPAPINQMEEIKSGTGVPFFCVKGAGDVGGSYETFANALGDDQPFYGIADLDFEDLEAYAEPITVEVLARRCIQEMVKVRPHGPYYLGGYSFGGIVAYEIARQLLEAGEEVPLIAMLDSGIPDHEEAPKGFTIDYATHLYNRIRARVIMTMRTWKLLVGYARDGVRIALNRATTKIDPNKPRPRFGEYLRWIQLDTSVQYFLAQAGLVTPTIRERRLEMVEEQLVRHSTRSMVASKQALVEYELKPIAATITLFRAAHNPWRTELRDPTLGWSRYAEKGVDVVIVPGNHMVIIRRPYANDLGEALQRAIDGLKETPRDLEG